ncbi:hypothetical protein RCJ22_19600 [Vibrio sp. FNV 38]|nr:hypothetical protein [Vibrio sp. FNV 38]
MLLEQILEIIEYTDSDLLEDAMEIFNREGRVDSDVFPFLNCVFEQAPNELCARLSRLGFKGDLEVQRVELAQGHAYTLVDIAGKSATKRTENSAAVTQ